MNFIKSYFKFLDFFAPAMVAKKAYTFMSNPQVKKLRDFEEEILNQAEQGTIKFKNFDIKSYSWGKSKKIVMLIHGWEGQTGNFGALVSVLLSKGYQVIGFDAPAHGNSSKGKTNMFEFADFISLMLNKHQPKIIISHSFGSVTTATALRQNTHLPIEQWIMITTPSKFIDRIHQMADYIGVTDKTVKELIKLIEKDLKEDVYSLSMSNYCKEMSNVAAALIIHSKDDKILPIAWSREVHQGFPQSELVELDNLGHYKILWSAEMKEIINQKVY